MRIDGNRALRVANVTSSPGTLTCGWLPVGEDWRRRDEAVPLALIHGVGPGPLLYVQAVSDGDELNGLAVARRLIAELDPQALRGAVVVVPVANQGAFAVRQAADPRDGRKLNRCFPGNAEGSVTERLAHALFNQLVVHCNLVIDLHQNGTTPMIPEVRVRSGRRGPKHAESLELAFAFGLPHILDQQGPAGQLARAAPARGIPAIDPELGGNVGFDADAIEIGVAGVLNVLRHYQMLDGLAQVAQRSFIARRLVPLIAHAGGVIDFTAKLGDRLTVGQPVGRITDIFGGRPIQLASPVDGVFWIRRDDPTVSVGDTVGAIGVEDEGP